MRNKEKFDGVEKAAILMLSLGEAEAAEVMKHMSAKEVQKVGQAMAAVSGSLVMGDQYPESTGIDERHLGHVDHDGSVLALVEPVVERGTRRCVDLARDDEVAIAITELQPGCIGVHEFENLPCRWRHVVRSR